MRHSQLTTEAAALLALALVSSGAPALAATADVAASSHVEASVAARPAPAPRAPSLPLLGIMTDAGLPDGLAASLVYRPLRWLRVSGGGTYNLISSGVRGGVSLLPFGWGPSLSVEGGHYFDGDANKTIQRFAGAGYKPNAALERVGYDYANAHLGLDLGYRRVTFYIHGGMSYIRTAIHNLDQVAQSEAGSSSSTTISIKQDPTVRAFVPSAKLGLIVYLW
jgi:hypothetical protein